MATANESAAKLRTILTPPLWQTFEREGASVDCLPSLALMSAAEGPGSRSRVCCTCRSGGQEEGAGCRWRCSQLGRAGADLNRRRLTCQPDGNFIFHSCSVEAHVLHL
eukprot:6172667-Pleurochrysis_carterae.AAC.3